MNLSVKNLPDETYVRLKRAAAEHGRSLNSEIVQILNESAEQSERLRRIRRIRPKLERFVASLPETPSSTELIREDRERR